MKKSIFVNFEFARWSYGKKTQKKGGLGGLRGVGGGGRSWGLQVSIKSQSWGICNRNFLDRPTDRHNDIYYPLVTDKNGLITSMQNLSSVSTKKDTSSIALLDMQCLSCYKWYYYYFYYCYYFTKPNTKFTITRSIFELEARKFAYK